MTGSWKFPHHEQGKKKISPFENYVQVDYEWLVTMEDVTKLIALRDAGLAVEDTVNARREHITRIWMPEKYFPKLYRRTQKLIEKVNRANWNYKLDGWEHECKITIYDKDAELFVHQDHSEVDETKITLLQVVDDDYSGGNLLLAGRYDIRMVAGDVIVMPGWMQHGVATVTGGRRISFAAWACGPRFDKGK